MRLNDLKILRAPRVVPIFDQGLDNLLQRLSRCTLLRMVVFDQQGIEDQVARVKVELLRILVGYVHEDGDERTLENL